MKTQKKDPLIDRMNDIGAKLLNKVDSGMVEDATTDQKIELTKLDIEAFNSVAKWISVKNRLDDDGEGDGISGYKAILNKPPKRGSHSAKGSSGVPKVLDSDRPAATPTGIRAIQARLAGTHTGGAESDSLREGDAGAGPDWVVHPDANGHAQPGADDAGGDGDLGADDLHAAGSATFTQQ